MIAVYVKMIMYQEGDLVWTRAHPQSWAEDAHMAELAVQWKGPAEVMKNY